jgi:hypothetical protein
MTITVTLPEDLHSRPNSAREALEAFAIEGYRTGALTPRETREMLGFETRDELDGFLKQHEVWEHSYSMENFEQDLRSIGR